MAPSSSSRILLQLLLPIILSISTTTTTFGLSSTATESSPFLTAHNDARRQVGVPPLSWDPNLVQYAKAYAAQRRQDCQLVHSEGSDYGENIFWGKGRQWSTTDAVAAWVGEKQWYNYDTNSCSGPDCTHYTQVVWRTTERLGCARVVCATGDTFAVCEYYPHGNYAGVRPY